MRGVVRGGAGQTVRLSRAENWSQEQAVAPDGSYRFTGLAPGAYAVALGNTGVTQTGIILDGRNEVVVDLAAPGWGWEVTDGGAGPGFGVVRCRVTGRSDRARSSLDRRLGGDHAAHRLQDRVSAPMSASLRRWALGATSSSSRALMSWPM